MKKNEKAIDGLLTRAVEHIYPSADALRTALEKKKLTIYHGIDPTAPTLHIGHGVVLKKLRDFQRLGHQIILLIGDFTAMIGDPTDKTATRKQLTREEVLANCRNYQKQAARFLDFDDKKNPVQLRFNSEWTDALTIKEFVELAGEFTVHQFLARDMFRKREEEGKDIHINELLYPLFQGYDSVALNVDVEIGGNDQTFNMLIGRDMMKHRGKEKFVMTTKLLVDPTGKKMGKTEGNMITFDDALEEMYGKVMAWGDGMIVGGFELCTDVPMEEVHEIAQQLRREDVNPVRSRPANDSATGTLGRPASNGVNPRDVKMRLAREIVALYHGAAAAKRAEAKFISEIQNKEIPQRMPILKVKESIIKVSGPGTTMSRVLVDAGLASSGSDAHRVIKDGGVKILIDGKFAVWKTTRGTIEIPSEGLVIKKGPRRFVRVVVE